MKLLALDCSTQACSAALLADRGADSVEIVERHELAAKSHTERLLPMVDALLGEAELVLADIDAIAFGCGPGSFTGLRICLGAVQGLALGAGLPVVPVSTLAALAQTALSMYQDEIKLQSGRSTTQILSAIDARMDEIYWGVYNISNGLVALTGSEQLSAPEQLQLSSAEIAGRLVAVGTGLQYSARIACSEQLVMLDDQLLPRASAVAELAREQVINNNLCAPEDALPTYLRDDVAWKKQHQQ